MSNIIKLGGGGGSSPVLVTKSITANGTYNASSDNADGYSSVTVNVAGGGSVLDTKITSAGTYTDYDPWNANSASKNNFTYVHGDYFLDNGTPRQEICGFLNPASGYEGFCFECSRDYTLTEGSSYTLTFVLELADTIEWMSGYQCGIKRTDTKIANFNTSADQQFTRQAGRQNVSFTFTAGATNYFAILMSGANSGSGLIRLIDMEINPAT